MADSDSRPADDDGLRTLCRHGVILDMLRQMGEATIYDRVVGLVVDTARQEGARPELVAALEARTRAIVIVAEARVDFHQEREPDEWKADIGAALATVAKFEGSEEL